MRVTTLGDLGAVAPIVSSQGSLVGLGEVTDDSMMTTKHVGIFAAGVLVGALGTYLFGRRRKRR
jgi:thioredoxin reductase